MSFKTQINMKKKFYEVHFLSHCMIEAKDLREANELFEKGMEVLIRDRKWGDDECSLLTEALSFYDCEEHKEHEVLGKCEVSHLSIFEGDDYQYDTEGIMWLKEFYKQSDPPTFEEFCEKNGLGERDVKNDINEPLDRL